MKPVAWMSGVSAVSWLALIVVSGRENAWALFLGLIAPLVVALGTWIAIERTHKRDPARVTPLMIAAFAGKLVFFGTYVVVVLRVLHVRPLPFVISFTGYFIGLHVAEALLLRRLFMNGTGAHR
jgi:hypothetical protein